MLLASLSFKINHQIVEEFFSELYPNIESDYIEKILAERQKEFDKLGSESKPKAVKEHQKKPDKMFKLPKKIKRHQINRCS